MSVGKYKILTTDWELLKSSAQTALKNVYDAAAAKNATMPTQANKTLANLANCVASIPSGATVTVIGEVLYVTGGIITPVTS